MPIVAAIAPKLPPMFKTDMAAPSEDQLLRREHPHLIDSRTAIPEEDESIGTASEPTKLLTATGDSAPLTHPFRHEANADAERKKALAARQRPAPTSAPSRTEKPRSPPPEPPRTVSRTNSDVNMTAPADQLSPNERPKFGKRVGSFVRNALHRTSSHNHELSPEKSGEAEKIDKAYQTSSEKAAMKHEKVFVKTGVDGSADVSAQALSIPSYQRLSSFSLSARSSPKPSVPSSPPSPGTPSSTISDEGGTPQRRATFSHKHSTSSTAISNMGRTGVKWAGGPKEKKPSRFSRRRSASTEAAFKADPNDQTTVGLVDTFSKHAAEGVGLKARRLSLSLPDEFVVDCCELDKEFKSSSLMPGKRGKCLGRGATAEVRIMARRGHLVHEELVAVKEFRGREDDEEEEDYIMKIKSEYSIAKSLHHPNIVETVRLCTNRNRWNHVMEFCSHGELFTLVERKLFSATSEGFYTVNDRLCFFKQLLRGVDYLHSHGIAHRDIKLENLLLDKEGHLKISDFGVAEVFSGEHPGLRAAGGACGKNMGEIRLSKPGICGSLPYIAPEVLAKKDEYDPRPLDIWSCAIVYLTMTFGGSPWQAAKPEFEYYARFKKGWDTWLPDHPDAQITDAPDGHPKCGKLFSLINPPPIKRLLLKMLHPLPDKRITIRDVMKSACVKNIDCCCPETYDDPASACAIDASKSAPKNGAKAMTVQFLHHHIPPKAEKKVAKAFTHRFDMGDGW